MKPKSEINKGQDKNDDQALLEQIGHLLNENGLPSEVTKTIKNKISEILKDIRNKESR